MDFSSLDPDGRHRAFVEDVRAFLAEHVTEEVRETERRTGDGYNREFYRALGSRGWIRPELPRERGGAGLDRIHVAILRAELERAKAPTRQLSTIRLVSPAIEQYGQSPLREQVLDGIARGEVCLSLGFTEPQGGSDVASARLRATRDGDEWTISGSKMFTTNGHQADYCFLLTRTDPAVGKHKGLTMFLMPLKIPGVEAQGIFTFSGERTNMMFYDDARISDLHRLGEVNGGWSVLRGPLDAEHGLGGMVNDGLDALPMGPAFLYEARDALDAALDWAEATGAIGDGAVVDRLADAIALSEAAFATDGASGRVLGAEALDRIGAELISLIGPEALLEHEAADGGMADFAYRYAQGTKTYGGAIGVFRTVIAQHELGLPRMELPGSRAFLAK
ncbi:acyl-CoA dehydrogenase family protein [Microbacterium sp. B19]|uniref:acyl-CoA dehydrogenase family protein n=1 Tax=Microbacterium sp. B19 TaxID=96765 RepID=UPI0003499EE9|nr:acyl-CoA dehydrogenase family protein [Microbacterium sp. B19]